MKKIIHHSRPFIGKEEKEALRSVLSSGHLSQGHVVSMLERELSTYVGHSYGIAVSSGTAALYLSLLALEVKEGDSVIMPSYVCTALLNAVLMAGASPRMCDVDPDTGNMVLDKTKKALTKKTKAIIVPHLFGFPADIEEISKLGVPIIEDCAQCVGAKIRGKMTGSLSEISVFSFYSTKMICAGEGGMVAVSDPNIAEKIRLFREYDKRDVYRPCFNFKLSDLHAAVARVQLKKLPKMIGRRRRAAKLYSSILGQYPQIELPVVNRDVAPVYYRYVVKIGQDINGIIRKMRRFGIECSRPVFKPLHLFVGKKGFGSTEQIHSKAISLPIHPVLNESDIRQVADTLMKTIIKKGRL